MNTKVLDNYKSFFADQVKEEIEEQKTINRSLIPQLFKKFDELSDAISQAYQSFNRVSDPALMESCICGINALRSKRDAVLRDIRKLE